MGDFCFRVARSNLGWASQASPGVWKAGSGLDGGVDMGRGRFELATDERTGGDGAVDEARPPRPAKQGGDRDVGNALRSVYDQTVSEDIPVELLDLLGKLD